MGAVWTNLHQLKLQVNLDIKQNRGYVSLPIDLRYFDTKTNQSLWGKLHFGTHWTLTRILVIAKLETQPSTN